MTSRKTALAIGAAAFAVLAVAFGVLFGPGRVAEPQAAYSAPGIDPLTFEEARAQFFLLTPALLLVVYDAFGRTGEGEIYDTLAAVAHGDALEELYLDRIGAMAGGGLEEADQTIHEITLLTSQASTMGDALSINATWQVIGTVGHAEHLHVRGNTYSADLTLSPVDEAWKITGFDLTDVSRDGAGETFLAPQTN